MFGEPLKQLVGCLLREIRPASRGAIVSGFNVPRLESGRSDYESRQIEREEDAQ